MGIMRREECKMSEKTQEKGSLLTQAIKAVKGENTQQLIENFTSEMTLVAEGLFEDQAMINRRMDDLTKEQDSRLQSIQSEITSVDEQREEDRRDLEKRLDELKSKIAELEKKNREMEKKLNDKKGKSSTLNKIIILALIICITAIIVMVLGKLL